MAGEKVFLTLDQQIDFLINDKGLIIDDHDVAINALQQLGYFSLINGYKDLFRIPLTKKYKMGTNFENFISLYRFDADLRLLLLKYLLQIERHLRSLVAYYFSETFGSDQRAYLDENNYNTTRKTHSLVSQVIHTLERTLETNDHSYIKYYREVYKNVPLWVLINAITFGRLSKLFRVLPQQIQSKICKNFPGVMPKDMNSFLSVLTKFRNVCAHGERLFSYRTFDTITDMPVHRKMLIPKKGEQYLYGKNDVFAVIIAFRYLLPDKDFLAFQVAFCELDDQTIDKLGSVNHSALMAKMGLPDNWKEISHYFVV